MTRQLELIDGREEWVLDETTRDVGRRGVERARAALVEARRRLADDHDTAPAHRAA